MKHFIAIIALGITLTAAAVTGAFAEVSGSAGSAQPNEIDSLASQVGVVTLDGEPLFRVRGMAGFSGQKRADAISDRLELVAENVQISTADVAMVVLADRTNIMAGDTLVASLLDADAAIEKIPLSVLVERIRMNIIHAILDYRHDRSPMVLFRRTLIALLATLLIVLFLLGLGQLFRRMLLKAEHHIKTRVENLEKRSSQVIESKTLWTAFVSLLNAIRFIVMAVALYLYLNFVLGLFPWTRPLASRLFLIFIHPLQSIGSNFLKSVPNLVFLFVLFLVVRYILKIGRLFFAGIERGNIVLKDFDQEWAWPTYRIVRWLTICFSLVVAYPYIPGSSSEAFKGISLFIGVLFSLGSTSFIANIIGGIALTYRRAFKVGDIIKVNEVMGLVTGMKIQATHLRTAKNETIVIPNSIVLNNSVTNYSALSKDEGIILHTLVGIGYEVPWRQVEAMLLTAAGRTTGLKKDSKPFVLQRTLDTFCVQYELNVYCDVPTTMLQVYNDLHKNVLDVFNEYGIQIMTPAYEGDPQTPKIVPKDQWHAAPAAPK